MAQAFHCDGLRVAQACFAGGPEVPFLLELASFMTLPVPYRGGVFAALEMHRSGMRRGGT